MIGNTTAALVGPDTTFLPQSPGLLGRALPRLAAHSFPTRPHQTLMIWTDGLDPLLDPSESPGMLVASALESRRPLEDAAVLALPMALAVSRPSRP